MLATHTRQQDNMAAPEVCYNDCVLNRIASGKQTRCYICQLHVHNTCLGVPKKTIDTGAWTCRNCRRIPTTIDVMHDLIVRLCDKVDNLESLVSSLQKSNVSSTATQTMDSRFVNKGTISEPIHYDLIDLSTGMQPDNTSATASFLHEMLDDMAVESCDSDDADLNSSTSKESGTPSDNHQYIYIGNTSVGSTRDELFALLCHIGVKNIIDIETVSKFNRQYVSFCVTVANKSDADLIYFHTWRSGIIVEPSKIHTKRLGLNSTTSPIPHLGIKDVRQRKRHLAPRLRRSLEQSKSESSMLRESTALAADHRHTRRGKAPTDEPSPKESSAPTTTSQPAHQATRPTCVQQGAQRYKTTATERSSSNFPYHPAAHNSTPMLPWGVPMPWFYPGMPFSYAHMPSAYPANRHSAPVQAQHTAQEILPATPPCTTVPPQHTAQGIPPVPPPSTPVQTQHTAQGILPVSHPSTPVPTQHTAQGNLSVPPPSTPVNTHNKAQGLLPVSPFRTAVPSQRPTPIHMSTPVPSVR